MRTPIAALALGAALFVAACGGKVLVDERTLVDDFPDAAAQVGGQGGGSGGSGGGAAGQGDGGGPGGGPSTGGAAGSSGGLGGAGGVAGAGGTGQAGAGGAGGGQNGLAENCAAYLQIAGSGYDCIDQAYSGYGPCAELINQVYELPCNEVDDCLASNECMDCDCLLQCLQPAPEFCTDAWNALLSCLVTTCEY